MLGVGFGVAGCRTELIDHGKAPCNAFTCSGCCTQNGVCLPGGNQFACGLEATSCRKCTDAQTCQTGVCTDLFEPDAGPLPDAGTPSCGPHNCPGCCDGSVCVTFPGQDTSLCGAAGASCGACDGDGERCESGTCVDPGCQLELGPTVLDFGAAAVGTTSRVEVMLENRGEGTCQLSAPAWLAGADLNAFGFNGQTVHALELSSGQRAHLTVSFTPYTERSWTGQAHAFTVTANDGAPSECASGAPGCRRVVVQGLGESSDLPQALLPSAEQLDLGEAAAGCRTPWRTLVLLNTGGGPISVSELGVGPAGSGFELAPVTLPVQVADRAALALKVRFTAPGEGTFGGLLQIEDELHGTRTLPLSARGVAPGPRTFSTRFPAPADRDVLVVMHDGTGMSSLQQAVAQATGALVTRLQDAGGAWRLGVIRSDASHAGAGLLQGSPEYATPSSTLSSVASNLMVGQTEGSQDRSLEALRLAVFPPNSTDVLRNGSFFRPGIPLSVLFVSNSDERSGGGLVDHVTAVQAAAGHTVSEQPVRLAGLLAANNCAHPSWHELFSLTDGACFPVSTANTASPLQQAVAALVPNNDAFALPWAPEQEEPVAVFVDGALVAPVYYSVERPRGLIRFAPLHVPHPGSDLHVEWTPACEP